MVIFHCQSTFIFLVFLVDFLFTLRISPSLFASLTAAPTLCAFGSDDQAQSGHWQYMMGSQYKPEAENDERHMDLCPNSSGSVAILVIAAHLWSVSAVPSTRKVRITKRPRDVVTMQYVKGTRNKTFACVVTFY
jgi:hypothetical protein